MFLLYLKNTYFYYGYNDIHLPCAITINLLAGATSTTLSVSVRMLLVQYRSRCTFLYMYMDCIY